MPQLKMEMCKGINRDGTKCNRKTRVTGGSLNDGSSECTKPEYNYCWQHCQQFLLSQGEMKVPKKVFKMPVDICIDKHQLEINSLRSDVDFISNRLEKSTTPPSLEELSEFSHKTFKMEELTKAVEKLELKKKNNYREEKQFRVLVYDTPKKNSVQVPNTERLVESAGFKRAIDFEIRKLQSRQKKLDYKKNLHKEVKKNDDQD